MNLAAQESAFMRAELARAGIVLDDPKPRITHRDAKPANVILVARGEVRARLVARGAPERDLEWLVESCPSLAAATNFRPWEEL